MTLAAATARDQAQQAVCESVCGALVRNFGEGLRAVVLTGSLARGEGSIVECDEGWQVLGDAEFLVILHDHATVVSDSDFTATARELERLLAGDGVRCRIDLSAAHADYFRRMQPHIFAYELRSCGRVLAGDPGVLQEIPAFTAADIPPRDAWYMLCNRIIEQLAILAEVTSGDNGALRRSMYQSIKFVLDLATSMLVFVGAYEPTYRGRAQRLATLAKSPGDAPLATEEFAARVRACTEFKLNPGADAAAALSREDAVQQCIEPARLACELWLWEVARMLHRAGLADVRDAGAALLGAQPMREKAKGWLYALRNDRPALQNDPGRTMRLALAGSPRLLTYLAATRLYFALPEIKDQQAASRELEEIRDLLPVVSAAREALSWTALCRDITWNYEHLLTRTRLD